MTLTDLAIAYHKQLVDHDQYGYFTDAGIARKTVNEFRLGWIVEPLLAQHEAFVGQPLFPYWTVTGRCIQLRANAFVHDAAGEQDRTMLGTDFPLQVPSSHLYNVRHALPGLRTAQVIVCSDVRSVLMARQSGWRAVAAPGFHRWYEPWNHLFDDAHVALVYSETEDGDAEAVARQLVRRGVEVLPMRLPDGETFASTVGPDAPAGVDLLELAAMLPVDVAPGGEDAN